MALETYSNAAQTTTTGSINNTSDPVTFSVTDGSTFPASGNFRILIDSEIMLCTSRSGNSLTCTRAQEGTTIASHTSSSTVTHLITAGAYKSILADMNIVDTFSNRPAAGQKGRIFRTTTPAGTYWRDNGSTWDMYFQDFGPLNPNITDFTSWINQTSPSATTDFTNGIYTINCASDANTASLTENLALRIKTAPSTPYTLSVAFRLRCNSSASLSAGIVTRDSATGHITALACGPNAAQNWIFRWNNPQSFSGNPYTSTINNILFGGYVVFMRVVNDGTNFNWYNSMDGVNWHRTYTEAVSGAFCASVDGIGFYLNYQNRNITGAIPIVSMDVLHAVVT